MTTFFQSIKDWVRILFTHRHIIQQLEQSIKDRDIRISEFDTYVATWTEKLRGMQQACQNAEQTHEVLKREISTLHDHIVKINEGLAERDRLRVQVENLASVQERVQQLEIELNTKEALPPSSLPTVAPTSSISSKLREAPIAPEEEGMDQEMEGEIVNDGNTNNEKEFIPGRVRRHAMVFNSSSITHKG